MKKFFMFAAIAAMTLSFASCNKEKANGSTDEDETGIKLEYRIKTLDDYTFSYNTDGTVASVVNGKHNRQFTYGGSKLTIKDGDAIEYEMTLNKDGFATEVKTADNTWTIEYDANGFMIKASKDGTQCTSQAIEDNNVLYWTRYDKDNDFWRMKDATYLSTKNVGQVQTHWAEDLGMERWMHEARLFGNTSVNVLETCRWHNFGDEMAAKTAVYDYEYDANGCITKETKYYGVWNETDFTGMDFDDEHTFTWEKIN